MILLIEHVANGRLIHQRKKTLMDKNTDNENSTRTNHHFKVENRVQYSSGTVKQINIKPHIRDHTTSYKRGPMGR